MSVRTLPALLATVLVLAAPTAAVEPEEAQAVWEATHGQGSVEVDLGAPVMEGEPIQGRLRLPAELAVDNVTYQICRVGNVCFALGVPLDPVGDAWVFDTRDIPAHVGRNAPTTYAAGERIGVQFHIGTPDGLLIFPDAERCDILQDEGDWVACEETHYFAVTISEAERAIAAPASALVMLALAAAALFVRRR